MTPLCRLLLPAVVLLAGLPILAGCTTAGGGFSNPFTTAAAPSPPPPPPVVPPGVRAEEIVGRWGLASHHREQGRPRTDVAAESQCAQAYKGDPSSAGRVMMLARDNPQVQEMNVKRSV